MPGRAFDSSYGVEGRRREFSSWKCPRARSAGAPGPKTAYIFNGDIADRGDKAVEIFSIVFLCAAAGMLRDVFGSQALPAWLPSPETLWARRLSVLLNIFEPFISPSRASEVLPAKHFG